tara:strand:- start:409 stop:588 length:180 start_codon:yes stop_codon:yes gene_type:complete
MSKNLNLIAFDSFVDDILESEENLLKGELDLLLMQHLFNSSDLDSFKRLDDFDNTYLVA